MRKEVLIAVLIVIGVVAIWTFSSGEDLETQVLKQRSAPETVAVRESEDECSKLSENAANDCYLSLALTEKKASYCDEISKPSQRKNCQREVELIP